MTHHKFNLGDRVRVLDGAEWSDVTGQTGTIVEVDESHVPYLVELNNPNLSLRCIWCYGKDYQTGNIDLEPLHTKGPSRNSLEELKRILEGSTQRENLLFQWVKEDRISFKQFLGLLEYREELREAAIQMDLRG